MLKGLSLMEECMLVGSVNKKRNKYLSDYKLKLRLEPKKAANNTNMFSSAHSSRYRINYLDV